MALFRCASGGGAPQETVLWTWPATSGTMAAYTAQLSDSMSNYDYIAIDYPYGSSPLMRMITTPKSLRASYTNSGPGLYIGGEHTSTNYQYARKVFSYSNTTVDFGQCRKLNESGTQNGFAIPERIVGIKL